MTISDKGLELIISFEGFEAEAYQDVAGIWTIGYGTIFHDGRNVHENERCTHQQAQEWLLNDVQTVIYKLNNLRFNKPLNQNQFDALVSFAYNVGFGALANSTLYRYARQNPDDEHIWEYDKENPFRTCEFTRWCVSKGKVIKGLLSRRIKESDYYSQDLH